jgi:hypothetical protein
MCEDCQQPLPLELHHLRYFTEHGGKHDLGGEPIHGIETPDDLAALCRECHLARHVDAAGVFWRDPQERETHWATY